MHTEMNLNVNSIEKVHFHFGCIILVPTCSLNFLMAVVGEFRVSVLQKPDTDEFGPKSNVRTLCF